MRGTHDVLIGTGGRSGGIPGPQCVEDGVVLAGRLRVAALHPGPAVQRSHAESASQHDAILDALRSGDAAAASARTYQHIMGAAH